MQEEVENKTVNLAVTTTKLSAKVLWRALNQYVNKLKTKVATTIPKYEDTPTTGKQSVKELIGQNQGVSTMPIGETGLMNFQRIAKKYGVDFAVVKDKTTKPMKYTIFFKARDADAITQVLQEYSAKQLKKQNQKSSVLKKLKKYKDLVASLPKKVVDKKKEKSL